MTMLDTNFAEPRATPGVKPAAWILALTATLFAAAIFGFFYAWACSTLWGLDLIDPRVAMDAMKGMNQEVRNFAFAPSFFGTPVLLGLAAYAAPDRAARLAFAAAAAIYLVGGLLLTAFVNVPMNRALAETPTPSDLEQAREIWTAYSEPWKFWNWVRTLASGVAALCAFYGLIALGRRAAAR